MADAQFMSVVATAALIADGLAALDESYVTALWTNIVSYYFPTNINDANGKAGYLISHELIHSGISDNGRTDMTLAHATRLQAGNVATLVTVPFLTLEAKRAGGSMTEATDQLKFALADIYLWLANRGHDSKLWGLKAVGLTFEFVEVQRIVGGTGLQLVAPMINGQNYGGVNRLDTLPGRLLAQNFLRAMRVEHHTWFQAKYP